MEDSDEEMGSVTGLLHGGVPGERTESEDGSLHGVSAGSLGKVAEEAPPPSGD